MKNIKFIIYHDSNKTASPIVHEAIDNEEVVLGKLVLYIDNEEWQQHGMQEVCLLIKVWKAR